MLGMVVHICNQSTRDTKAGGSQVLGQPRLYSEIQSHKTKHKTQNQPINQETDLERHLQRMLREQ